MCLLEAEAEAVKKSTTSASLLLSIQLSMIDILAQDDLTSAYSLALTCASLTHLVLFKGIWVVVACISEFEHDFSDGIRLVDKM